VVADSPGSATLAGNSTADDRPGRATASTALLAEQHVEPRVVPDRGLPRTGPGRQRLRTVVAPPQRRGSPNSRGSEGAARAWPRYAVCVTCAYSLVSESDGSDLPIRVPCTRSMSTPSMSARSSFLGVRTPTLQSTQRLGLSREERRPQGVDHHFRALGHHAAAQVGGVRDGGDPGPSRVPVATRGQSRTHPRQRAELVCASPTYGARVSNRWEDLQGTVRPSHRTPEAKTSWHAQSDLDKVDIKSAISHLERISGLCDESYFHASN
jgi:hypothetical protein